MGTVHYCPAPARHSHAPTPTPTPTPPLAAPGTNPGGPRLLPPCPPLIAPRPLTAPPAGLTLSGMRSESGRRP